MGSAMPTASGRPAVFLPPTPKPPGPLAGQTASATAWGQAGANPHPANGESQPGTGGDGPCGA
eukprot:369847-Alexandrium_andersonii.AAC.1